MNKDTDGNLTTFEKYIGRSGTIFEIWTKLEKYVLIIMYFSFIHVRIPTTLYLSFCSV